jgi:hypothetical protein
MFYVYHKVKGDRLQGPEYRFLGEHEVRVAAAVAAADYNQARGYKARGMHCAVVRQRKVKM